MRTVAYAIASRIFRSVLAEVSERIVVSPGGGEPCRNSLSRLNILQRLPLSIDQPGLQLSPASSGFPCLANFGSSRSLDGVTRYSGRNGMR